MSVAEGALQTREMCGTGALELALEGDRDRRALFSGVCNCFPSVHYQRQILFDYLAASPNSDVLLAKCGLLLPGNT